MSGSSLNITMERQERGRTALSLVSVRKELKEIVAFGGSFPRGDSKRVRLAEDVRNRRKFWGNVQMSPRETL